MAFASEGTEDEVVGIVEEIYEDYLVVDVDGELLEIPFGQNFDPETVKIEVGDEVVIKTCENEDGGLVITELKIQERLRDRVMTQDGELESNYCAVDEVEHPVAAKVADLYGIDYSEMEGYLCGETHIPLGQIMLALATSEITGVDFTDYLDGFENIKWGQIWQEFEMKGKPGHGIAPGQIKKQDGEAGNGTEQTPPQSGK
jgi:hypothetical protein